MTKEQEQIFNRIKNGQKYWMVGYHIYKPCDRHVTKKCKDLFPPLKSLVSEGVLQKGLGGLLQIVE